MIEPSGSAFTKLQGHFQQSAQVGLLRAAVADAIGEAFFYEEGDAGETSSLLDRSHPAERGTTKVRAPITTVDQEMKAAGWTSLDIY